MIHIVLGLIIFMLFTPYQPCYGITYKGVDYYIIDPTAPSIISEFNYGYMYDDLGSIAPGFFNDFRLNTDDIGIVEAWMKETGVNIYDTDFPIK